MTDCSRTVQSIGTLVGKAQSTELPPFQRTDELLDLACGENDINLIEILLVFMFGMKVKESPPISPLRSPFVI